MTFSRIRSSICILWFACPFVTLLSACGDNGGSSGGGRVTYTVSGVISNLTADGLVLQLNGADDLQIGAANSVFEFTSGLTNGEAYSITVKQNPASEDCTISRDATGTVAGANVVGVPILCTPKKFTLGGNITTLLGQGLVLKDTVSNDSVSVAAAAGSYTITPGLDSGSNYTVTVVQPPTNPSQSCSISNASGQVGTVNVTNIDVACVTASYSVGGTVTGLAGSGLVLKENLSGQTVSVSDTASTVAFAFPAPILSGTGYKVSVLTQPSKLNQTCTVQNGDTTSAGTTAKPVTNSAITSIQVSCVTNLYGVSGDIDGNAAGNTEGLVLFDTLNGTQATIVGTHFTFPYPAGGIPDGSRFEITLEEIISTFSNTHSHCLVDNPGYSGTIAGQNFTSVKVTCRLTSVGLVATAPATSDETTGTIANLLVDPISGAISQIKSLPTADQYPNALTVGSRSTVNPLTTTTQAPVYVSNLASVSVFAAGATTLFGPTGSSTYPSLASLQIVPYTGPGSPFGADALALTDPSDTAGTFAYVPWQSVGEISTYAVDPSSGTLSNGSNTAVSGWSPVSYQFILNQAGNLSYLFYGLSAGISPPGGPIRTGIAGTFTQFTTSPTTGSLMQNDISSVVSASGFLQTTLTPIAAVANGPNLYVLADSAQPHNMFYETPTGPPRVVAYSQNAITRQLNLIPGSPFVDDVTAADFGSAILIDPTQTYLFVVKQASGISVFRIMSDGSLTSAPGSPFRLEGVEGLSRAVIDPSGRFLYVLASTTGNIAAYSINLTLPSGTNPLSLIGIYPFTNTPPIDMKLDASGKFLYVLGGTDSAPSSIAGFFVDPNTGALRATPGSPYTPALSGPSNAFVALP